MHPIILPNKKEAVIKTASLGLRLLGGYLFKTCKSGEGINELPRRFALNQGQRVVYKVLRDVVALGSYPFQR